MDAPESTKVVLQKVKELEPENATKIIGYILLQDYGEQEMIRLAFGSHDMIKSIIDKAKRALKLSPNTTTSNPDSSPKDKPVVSKLPTKFTPFVPSPHFSIVPHQIDNYAPVYQAITNNFEYAPFLYFDSSINGFGFGYQPDQFLPMEGRMECGSHFQNVPELSWDSRPDESPLLPELKFCERFNEGYCKFGGECKFLHVTRLTDDFIMVVNRPNASEAVKEYHVLSHGSVKKLEMELFEILRSKGLDPVPISTLPDLYREKYGRKLEVNGYYTEKFMHGKVICGLNQLLIHMTDNIRMIERNGEICVILAENIHAYLKSIDERNERGQGLATSPSCQVYLTFPPQSTFTQQDFYNYFNNYGPVKSVRIPVQLQRMFGFVTFVYPVTVTVVLSKSNPHFIRGMIVLVKPYRVKHAVNDRKSEENLQHSIRSLTDAESKNLSSKTQIAVPKPSGNLSFPKKQLIIEEHEQSVDINRNNILDIKVTSSSHNSSIKAVAGPSASRGVCTGCASKGKSVMIRDYDEERSEEVNLPDNPFAIELSHGKSSVGISEWEMDLEL